MSVIDRPPLHDVAGAWSQEALLLTLARVYVGVAPPVLFGQEQEGFAPSDPLQTGVQAIACNDPGRIGLVVDPVHLARGHVGG